MMNANWKKIGLLMVITGLVVSACSLLGGQSSSQPGADQSSVSNGEQIYFTGANAQGERIPYTGGPNFGGMMMGAYLTCAACHGPDAHGGEHFMHMQVMDAPPIYYEALNHMEAEESGHTPTSDSYTLEEFRSAVVEGQHPDGDELSGDMPRWQLSDGDLADLFAFLKTIPQ
jgi:cytochrome c oxidase subunit II